MKILLAVDESPCARWRLTRSAAGTGKGASGAGRNVLRTSLGERHIQYDEVLRPFARR